MKNLNAMHAAVSCQFACLSGTLRKHPGGIDLGVVSAVDLTCITVGAQPHGAMERFGSEGNTMDPYAHRPENMPDRENVRTHARNHVSLVCHGGEPSN